MDFNEACEFIKSQGKWDMFLTWFAEWFENNMENEELILETTVMVYAESLLD